MLRPPERTASGVPLNDQTPLTWLLHGRTARGGCASSWLTVALTRQARRDVMLGQLLNVSNNLGTGQRRGTSSVTPKSAIDLARRRTVLLAVQHERALRILLAHELDKRTDLRCRKSSRRMQDPERDLHARDRAPLNQLSASQLVPRNRLR